MKKSKKKNKHILVRLLLILIVIVMTGVFMMHRLFPLSYENEIQNSAQEFALPFWTVVAVIKTESNFDPNATSPQDAKGLMQLKESTADWYAQKKGLPQGDLSDPSYNIRIGCAYLSYLRQMFGGDIYVALAAYNAGEGNVRAWLQNPAYSPDGKTLGCIPFPETESYIKKIKLYQKIYTKLYQ